MKVFYGLDRQPFAEVVPRSMVSVRTVIKGFIPKGNKEWFMDSGAFTYLLNEGAFPFTPEKYIELVRRAQPDLWANMDYCCEDSILKSTQLTKDTHIKRTIENGRLLMDTAPGFVMVIQGYELDDYLRCIDMVKEQGLLTPVIGVGSVCRRNVTKQIIKMLVAIKREMPDWVSLHGFGVKTDILRHNVAYDVLSSVDTYAWAFGAQKDYVRGEGFNKFGRRRLSAYQEKLNRIIRFKGRGQRKLITGVK